MGWLGDTGGDLEMSSGRVEEDSKRQGRVSLNKQTNKQTKTPLFLRVFVIFWAFEKCFSGFRGPDLFLDCCFCEAVLAYVLFSCAW